MGRVRTRAVLLDAMGTLVDLDPPLPPLLSGLRSLGLEVSEAQAARALEREIRYYREHHLEGRDAASLGDLRRRCAAELRAALPAGGRSAPLDALTRVLLEALRFRAFPEVPGALERLRRRGLRVVAVSNWDVSLPEALRSAGLEARLDGVVSSAMAGAAKPDLAPFAHALSLAGVRAAEALHVGDSESEDVAGARAAGIPAVLLSRGRGGRALAHEGLAGEGPRRDRGGGRSRAAGVPVISSLAEVERVAP
jgi:putative hydrolase of the HAD superfamily